MKVMKHLNLKEQFYEKFRRVPTSLHEKTYSKIHKSIQNFYLRDMQQPMSKVKILHSNVVFSPNDLFWECEIRESKQANLILG